MDFKLNFTFRCEEHREEAEYGDWSANYEDYEYHSISEAKEAYSDVSLFPYEETPKVGEPIYVAYVSVNSGDSFGSSTGERTHLWAFTDKQNAENFCSAIRKDYKKNPDYKYRNENFNYLGIPIATSQWKGYFESLADCTFVEVTLT